MSMAFDIVKCGDVYVSLWVHSENDPTVEQWTAVMTRLVDLKRQVGGDVSKIRSLALTDGGAPNVGQRKELASDLFEGQVKAVAISSVLSNRLKRGIAT